MEFLFSSSVLFTTSLLLLLISFISSHIFRSNGGDSLKKDVSKKLVAKEIIELNNLNSDNAENKDEPSDFSFKFQYQIPDQPDTKEENQSPIATTVHKYQFISDKDISGFVKEPEFQFFHMEESCMDSAIYCSNEEENKHNQLHTIDLLRKDSSLGALRHDVIVKTVDQPSLTIVSKKPSIEILEEQLDLKDLVADSWGESKRQTFTRFLTEEFSGLTSDSDSGSVSDGYSVKDLIVDSDGILSDEDDNEFPYKSVVFEKLTTSSTNKLDLRKHRDSEEAKLQYFHDSNTEYPGSKDCFANSNHENEREELTQEEVVRIPGEAEAKDFNTISIELIDSSDDELLLSARDKFSSRENSDKILSEHEVIGQQNRQETMDRNEEQSTTELSSPDDHNLQLMNTSLNTASEKSELLQLQRDLVRHEPEFNETKETAETGNETYQKNHTKKANYNDEDGDDDDFDSLWEHEGLIEQLKMEIKRTRTNGLPTILEESESLKSDDDLKPCKIDEKLLNEDPISELHKFDKSYIERMRMLDILSYKKLYATGFLQLKDPLELLETQKFCPPSLSSIMLQLQNCPLRQKSSKAPSQNFVKELRCDLELVYVAQMCLSWEFLRWQYEKTRDLSESDSHIKHHYNQVAGEFQQFQVVIQRFIENETFQGPRLQNYVKNRCILQNLLQVPVVKEDSLKDKKEEHQKVNFIITSKMLEDIMEESIRIFWEFVKGDRDETPSFLKSIMGSNTKLQDPSNYELLKEIQSDLQKKEKKLNDILLTGNCLVKKFKKPKEDRSNQNFFFSQIDLKLVARVLRMPRITSEQLLWCKKKLCNITIVKRKIHQESSFFMFPC